MSVGNQLRSYLAVLPKARRNRVDLLRWLIRRPQLLSANAGYEMALLASAKTDPRLKALSELKAGTLITCDYCIDIGSALARRAGVTERSCGRCRRSGRARSSVRPRSWCWNWPKR